MQIYINILYVLYTIIGRRSNGHIPFFSSPIGLDSTYYPFVILTHSLESKKFISEAIPKNDI